MWRTLWKPIGQLSKISSRPGNCTNRKEKRTKGQDVASTLLRGEGGGGKGRKERTAHIERVYAPVELLDADILHRASPLNAIEDHLLRMGRIVSAGFQETPVCAARRKRGRA
jgi:hypothetical protein